MRAMMLPDGHRLHLQDGPFDLVIGADGPEMEVHRAFDVAIARFSTVRAELNAEISLLRQPTERLPEGAVARRMYRATAEHARSGFITPVAAASGAVAEEVLYAMVSAAAVERAHVNNGGSIAIHLTPWQEYRAGVVDRPDHPLLVAEALVHWTDAVRGISTSGWQRNFSFGIADAVTVLAATASGAEAAAMLVANAVDLPGHPAITRVPASDLRPESSLGARLVTQHVGDISPGDIQQALANGVSVAETLLAREHLIAAALHLGGETRIVGVLPLAAS
ncbi:UPF0280 family protein [Aestuariivirga sp.]|uniref:UPF0280 family protein n=1 Tax=Aestuariivirga sp. TaxID=2650926 RepID=UPI0039E3618E